MASAQQLIGLVKSHAEGDEERFFDLVIQLAAAAYICLTRSMRLRQPAAQRMTFLQNAGHGKVP